MSRKVEDEGRDEGAAVVVPRRQMFAGSTHKSRVLVNFGNFVFWRIVPTMDL